MTEEKTIWKGSSSQIINLGPYAVCGLAGVLITAAFAALKLWKGINLNLNAVLILLGVLALPIVYALWQWIENRSRVYELTTQRVKTTTGVFSKRVDELELYRVKDITLVEPAWQRLFGTGRIILTTNDASNPTLVLDAIPKVEELREHLRNSVETCREQKKVRLSELEM